MSERRGIDYIDFEVEIGEQTADGYPVTVLRSPAGEPRGVLRLPFEGLELENKLQGVAAGAAQFVDDGSRHGLARGRQRLKCSAARSSTLCSPAKCGAAST